MRHYGICCICRVTEMYDIGCEKMKFEYTKTEWDALSELIQQYHFYLDWKNDGFHNSMMFGGQAYRITQNGEAAGFFSLGEAWEGGNMLCGFYLKPEVRGAAAEFFAELIDALPVKSVLVPSNDQLLVSLAFEQMHQRKTDFEMQAYNFTYAEPKRPAEFGIETFSEITPAEYETADKLTEGQWTGCFGDPDFRFFAIRQDGEVLGYGAIAKMKYHTKYVDIGNFTLPQHRQKGVGRSMLIHLSSIAREQKLIPTAGCWYYNKESIPTLKSAGYLPENRLFYVKF